MYPVLAIKVLDRIGSCSSLHLLQNDRDY